MWWLLQSGFFDVMSVLVILIVVGASVFGVVSRIRRLGKNSNSPRLTVEAQVAAKHTSVTHHSSADDSIGHTSTFYYVTFQVESGDRMEFQVTGQEYGMLMEGDWGRLTFQGTWYLGFERQR
ncbi:MAG: DUF2500 domain-containing protein [Oscillospiraceae bacterium]|nr:DUF2500 domain-containing protein [Oscillospiraceae bacterium]